MLQPQYYSPTVPSAGKSSHSFLRLFNYLLCEFVQNHRQPTAFMIFLSASTWDVKSPYVVGHFCDISCSFEGAKCGNFSRDCIYVIDTANVVPRFSDSSDISWLAKKAQITQQNWIFLNYKASGCTRFVRNLYFRGGLCALACRKTKRSLSWNHVESGLRQFVFDHVTYPTANRTKSYLGLVSIYVTECNLKLDRQKLLF